MYRIIYSKHYLPVERKAEKFEDNGSRLSSSEKESLIASAINFSKNYKQGIDIKEQGNELTIDLYLTDHFFSGRGKEQLAILFARAQRVDLSLGREDVLFNFYYSIE